MNIEMRKMSKRIGGKEVLSEINFRFHGGVVYGLSGKNGCGKTMLMRSMCGLIYPTSGDVLVDGKRLGKEIDFIESCGALIENPSFLDNMTGFQNLKLLSMIKRCVVETDIQEILNDVGLDYHDKRKYRKYSLGMKQRLGIAAALMEKPDLILLDEPINALDTTGVERVHRLLDREKARGALIVVACHDSNELNELSDEIIYMSDGKIVEEAS